MFWCRPSVGPSSGYRTVRTSKQQPCTLRTRPAPSTHVWICFIFLSFPFPLLFAFFVFFFFCFFASSFFGCTLIWYHGYVPGIGWLQVIRDGIPQPVSTVPWSWYCRARIILHLFAFFHRDTFFCLFCDHGLHTLEGNELLINLNIHNVRSSSSSLTQCLLTLITYQVLGAKSRTVNQIPLTTITLRV